jgi:hypothetical protein
LAKTAIGTETKGNGGKIHKKKEKEGIDKQNQRKPGRRRRNTATEKDNSVEGMYRKRPMPFPVILIASNDTLPPVISQGSMTCHILSLSLLVFLL